MFQRPRGTRDFTPDEMEARNWVLDVMRKVAISHGFREIQMPTFEELELFTKKSGPAIVDELYAFKDKGDRDIALRPEMTAQTMRFYVSDLATLPKPLKLFYFGPCFRYENPQQGRYREFFQFGAEIIGSNTPETDAEAIALAVSQIRSVGLKNFKVRIGFIGIYRDLLRKLGFKDDEITDALHMLDKKDIDGFKRLAAKKKASDRAGEAIISIRDRQGGIEVLDGIEGPAKDYLKEMMGYLLALGISGCEIDLGIIRGLDYYSGMVFEIDAPNLGAEKQICGGGSYDLVPLFGGEQAFTTGFAIGFDRVLLALELEGFRQTTAPLDAFVIPVGDDARKVALEIVSSLRREEMSADFDIMRRSLSKSLKYASLVKAKKAIIIGDKELAKGAAIVRDMGTGEQSEVKIDQIAGSLKK